MRCRFGSLTSEARMRQSHCRGRQQPVAGGPQQGVTEAQGGFGGGSRK